jgi:hypothetical protein
MSQPTMHLIPGERLLQLDNLLPQVCDLFFTRRQLFLETLEPSLLVPAEEPLDHLQ